MRTYESALKDDSASLLIFRMARLLRHGADGFMRDKGIGLTPEQWGLLWKVARQEGCLQTDLADAVLKDHPNVTKMLDALEKRGLVDREPNPNDRRSNEVWLTEAGKALLDKHLPQLVEEKEEFFKGLDRTDLNRLITYLKTIQRNMERVFK
ncbi:MarR family transcriptional regulator [Patescibacteria group bacterium]|nr:MarR family transcriptional regulator [Patescibacteria group bacterium]